MGILEISAWFLVLDPLIMLIIILPAFFLLRDFVDVEWIVAGTIVLWLLVRRLVQKGLDRWK